MLKRMILAVLIVGVGCSCASCAAPTSESKQSKAELTDASVVRLEEKTDVPSEDESEASHTIFDDSTITITDTNHYEVFHNAIKYGRVGASEDDECDENGRHLIRGETEDGKTIDFAIGDYIAVLEETDNCYLIYYQGQKATFEKKNFREFGTDYELTPVDKLGWSNSVDDMAWASINPFNLPIFSEGELQNKKITIKEIKRFAKLNSSNDELYDKNVRLFGNKFICILGLTKKDGEYQYVVYDKGNYQTISGDELDFYNLDFDLKLVQKINECANSVNGSSSFPTQVYGVENDFDLPMATEQELSDYKKNLSAWDIREVIVADESEIIRYGRIKKDIQGKALLLWGTGSQGQFGKDGRGLFGDYMDCAIIKMEGDKYYLLALRCIGVPVDASMVSLYDEDYVPEQYAGWNFKPNGEPGYALGF